MARVEPDGATAALADFAAGVTLSALPTEVIAKVRELVLDCLGNQIGAYGEPSADMLYAALEVDAAHGNSTVVGYGTRSTALLAGCMNGMLAHLRDMDDAHRDALTKTGSAITPAALAVAEARGCTGARVIEAVVAGYETMIRLGLAVNPGHRSRGFHSTATLGAFGAAAAAGRLMNLSRSRMIDAFGIAGTQAAGLAAFINNEAMIKPFNVAKGVHSGILAATLAEKGFRGPPAILEGAEGFLSAYTDAANTAPLLENPGTRYRLLDSGFKPHAACRYAHAPIDAAIGLMREHRFAAGAIERIDVHLSALANRQSNFHEPKSVASAQGSTPFAIAAALASNASAVTVSCIRAAFRDQAVWELHRRVKLAVDPQMDYLGRGCRIELVLRDGRRHVAQVDLPRGEPENPMSAADIQDKFMQQASATVGEVRAAQISDGVNALDSLESVSTLMALTTAATRSAHKSATASSTGAAASQRSDTRIPQT